MARGTTVKSRGDSFGCLPTLVLGIPALGAALTALAAARHGAHLLASWVLG